MTSNETNTTDREEFLQQRRTGIGGSDIGVIMGHSKYKSKFQLWQEKMGLAENDHDEAAIERMYWGTVLEPLILTRYAQVTGQDVGTCGQQLRHRDYKFATANIDGFVFSDPGKYGVYNGHTLQGVKKLVEIKTVNPFAYYNSDQWGDEYTDQVPKSYYDQVQWYMWITGINHTDLVALVGGQEMKIYNVKIDMHYVSQMVEQAQNFWNDHVIVKQPPEIDNADDALANWPDGGEGELEVSADVMETLREYSDVSAIFAKYKKQRDTLRDKIIPIFQDKERLTFNFKQLATLKKRSDKVVTDWQAVCQELEPSEELIKQHTTVVPGAKVLTVKKLEEA